MTAIRQPITTNSYFLFLEDGLPIRPLGIFNHNALLEINQFNLETIEIVKGPVSSIYGPEAVGGTINLISKKPSISPEFKFGIQADQWGFSRLQVCGGATIGKIGFLISGITTKQNNSWLANSDYEKENLNIRVDYTIAPKTKLISSTFIGKYYSDTGGSINEQDFYNRTYKSTTDFTYRKSDALRTRLTLEHNWNRGTNSFFTVYHRANKLGQNPSYGIRWSPTKNPTIATGEINSNNFKSYGVVAQHSQKFDYWNTNLIIGGQYDYSPVDYYSYLLNIKATLNPGEPGKQTVKKYEIVTENPEIKLANYTSDIFNKALYGQFNINPIEKLVITFGGRFDAMNIDYDNLIDASSGNKNYNRFTIKAGANFNPYETIGFYGNYAQGFSPPGITSIFRAKSGTGGNTGIPAEFYYNLKPAIFDNFEVGGWITLLKNKLSLEYAIYYLKGQNELLNVRQEDNSTDYRSAGETSHKGIEFGINYKPISQWHLRMGGTVAKHKFIDFKVSDKSTDALQNYGGFEMPSAPRFTGNSELYFYPKAIPNFRTSIECQVVSSFYQNQINTLKYEGYTLFNFRIGYHYKNLEFYGNILNLNDKLYAYNATNGNTTNSQASYTPAAPRTFVLGLQYNFSLKK